MNTSVESVPEDLAMWVVEERERRAAVPTPMLPPTAAEVLALDRPPMDFLPTGFSDLDRLLGGGLATRSLTTIVGSTGAGKTGLALGLGLEAVRAGRPCLYVSTELDAEEIAARVAALELRRAHRDILAAVIPRAVVRQAVAGMPVYVIGCESLGRGQAALERVDNAAGAIRDVAALAPLVIFDFMQGAVDPDPGTVRLAVSQIANELRATAQRLETAVAAVSSTGRTFYRPPANPEDRDDPLYYLAAAKESGDVEFASAGVIFLDVGSDHDGGVYPARIAVAKSRRGERGFVGARFDGPSGRWSAYSPALGEMSGAARAARAAEERASTDDTKLLEVVRKHGPKPWRALRDMAGMAARRADAAQARLLEAGAIRVGDEQTENARGQVRRRPVIEAVKP